MNQAFAVVALTAFSVTASAAPLDSQPAFQTSLSIATASLDDIPIDSSLGEFFVNDPALAVLGIQLGKVDSSSEPVPRRFPAASLAFTIATILAFSAVLVGRQRSLRQRSRRRRRVKLVMRPMAPV